MRHTWASLLLDSAAPRLWCNYSAPANSHFTGLPKAHRDAQAPGAPTECRL